MMMKLTFVSKTLLAIFTVCILTDITVAVAIAGHDFLDGDLRVDLPEIYNAGDYQILLQATGTPSSNTDYTDGWLGIDLANNPGTYGQLFSQIGLLTKADGVHWFVYTEAGAACIRGLPEWGSFGCQGTAGDIVTVNNWYRVEIISEGGGWWLFRLYDTYNTPYNLAQTWVQNSTRIYNAFATEEEAYTAASDPYLPAHFNFYHPQYMTTSGFKDWPSSSGGYDNIIRSVDDNSQNTFCPQYYGVIPNVNSDERQWYAGSGGQQCWWLLFPSSHVYLPLILNNS